MRILHIVSAIASVLYKPESAIAGIVVGLFIGWLFGRADVGLVAGLAGSVVGVIAAFYGVIREALNDSE